ncbi:MAG TPA: tRNA preQ1(34) S-adenosylmethionine ribosyltransferase-isomerase QueA [Caldisericia bacterium]|nr:tRNA preQ1(34) S-adenosylmethionine ribosyltransferase-isomerase QueA [Caldisericia bacterium]HPF48973.1 tRNA preQ1(34) S-adenosylmethionine ribosyltransferase-isomerase QueA [Caldisericia bacterium]HPI83163.1 tRNA preQ1(34) S-adenosylmethionine ribosyltransferase-isomerase QueA [Caldisericia bacterium]HPQ92390.1 tRNA preQ1(34) S-adenosylmethionine ribosyltransferase-isomerase QueA [Caldisericia bacterium]HRV74512.1 tRNA preQ1(34) S-adenosylmethionine ribosyltransferase-isomerase QueA [Caldi
MKLSDFWYELPKELISQEPTEKRDESRLMVLNRELGSIEHRSFFDVKTHFKNGDTLVLNNTKVIPARLFGEKETGGKCEVFLLKKLSQRQWKCLVKPGRRLQIGAKITIEGIGAKIIDRTDDGGRVIEFDSSDEEVFSVGEIPLPPYVHNETLDRRRYQTVYADTPGAVAAPTAGLHFTESLLDEIRDMGVNIAYVTLHVGIGTFRPIKVDDVDDHKMDFEWFELPEETANQINDTRQNGGRIFACGTTVVRTLESVADKDGFVKAHSDETNLFIKPGYRYKTVDKLITNFHLPGSTLLLLVSAFASRELIFKAYAEAIEERYRFFSFGDAMLIL